MYNTIKYNQGKKMMVKYKYGIDKSVPKVWLEVVCCVFTVDGVWLYLYEREEKTL